MENPQHPKVLAGGSLGPNVPKLAKWQRVASADRSSVAYALLGTVSQSQDYLVPSFQVLMGKMTLIVEMRSSYYLCTL